MRNTYRVENQEVNEQARDPKGGADGSGIEPKASPVEARLIPSGGSDPDEAATLGMFLSFFCGRRDGLGVMRGQGPKSIRLSEERYEAKFLGHIRGIERVGVYNVFDDDTVRFAVIDFDSHGTDDSKRKAQMDSLSSKCQRLLLGKGIACVREISKSGYGNYHVWIFFEEPILAARVRRILKEFLRKQVAQGEAEEIVLEVFPKQDSAKGGLGNFIWLPLFPTDVEQGRTIFVDADGARIPPSFSKCRPSELETLYEQPRIGVPIESPQQHGSQTQAPILSLLKAVGVTNGNRHDSLVKLTGHFKGKGISPNETEILLEAWNSGLREPLPKDEVNRTIRSLYGDGESRQCRPILELLTGTAIAGMTMPSQKFLIDQLVSEESVNFLVGEEGCGKSLLAMNLALSVAVGASKWLSFGVARKGKVLYLNNELSFSNFGRRLQAMDDIFPGSKGLDDIHVAKVFPAIEECWEALLEHCEALQPTLLVVDCLYFTHNRDENDSSDMKSLMRRFLTLRDQFNLALLLVHHTKKGARGQKMHDDLMRGSNVFASAADMVMQIRRSEVDETKRLLKPTKFRHVSDQNRACRQLSLDGQTLWFKDEGEAKEEDHLSGGQAYVAKAALDFRELFGAKKELQLKEIVELCKPLGIVGKTVQRRIEGALERGELSKPRFGVYSMPRVGQ